MGSEFGSGIVVCLAKFSEHLWNPSAVTVMEEIRYARMTEEEKEAEAAEARQYPKGDAAQRMASRTYSGILSHLETRPVSRAIESWANGASDHFYDLDKGKAPEPLRELADLTLRMGHGFTGSVWTEEDWTRVRALWKDACLAVDTLLGADAEWGDW